MSKKFKEAGVIVSQEEIAPDIFSLWLKTEHITENAVPGQFISMYCDDGSRLLPRPISICEVKKETGELRVVYRVIGKGTEEFSLKKQGGTIQILGPLGNGFPLEGRDGQRTLERKSFLIGGGIGIPPMLELAKQLGGERQVILGYRDKDTFLFDEFRPYASVYAATEDGSVGTKGNVMDAIRENGLEAEVIYACGPKPMLAAIKSFAAEHGIECWLSLEEKMACGIGACLACTCKTAEIDEHTNVHNKRICTEGPVFLAEEVEL